MVKGKGGVLDQLGGSQPWVPHGDSTCVHSGFLANRVRLLELTGSGVFMAAGATGCAI